jgi:ADP-ribosylglycohydrolase
MNLSNTGGAGRGTDQGDIIGDVINHGKKQYWLRGKGYHYHHTLEPGENTLEAQLCRVLMRSVVENGGVFSASAFQDAYIKFMTTPGSHNDTYASTCHRMFFENLVMKKRPPTKCPSNDGHNVDTMDGLVLPTVVALATATRPREEASEAVSACVSTTRNSPRLVAFCEVMTDLIRNVVSDGIPLETAAVAAGRQLGVDVRSSPGHLMTA